MSSAAAAAVGVGLPSLSVAGKAAATAGVAGGIWGKFAWGYSRSLYMFDAEFRFERMCAGYEMANAQQEMFRNDLVLLTELTFRKMGIYTVLGTMGMAIFIAIFCAGRLALHGPSPPIWIMGLFLTNIAFSFAMAGLGIWLCFHAMWRAKAATLHLNTRKIRLLIPTRKKLDEARKYGNQYEHQKVRDLARIPYVCDAIGWKWSGEVPDVSDDEAGSGSDYSAPVGGTHPDSRGRPHSAPPAGRRKGNGKKRVPCWFGEEMEQDRMGTNHPSGSAGQPMDAAPEHFQLYAKAQKEWFTHDCYARICFFYSFLSFFQGGAFYGLGQIFIETRAFWPAFANNFVFAVLHFLMLKFDIVKNPDDTHVERLPYAQYCGTAVMPLAALGMALDFRVEYWDVAIQLTWLIVFLCYILQILYAFRLLELVYPNEIKREERMGNMWWPVGWKVPASFQHVFYFVAPPPRLATEKGQFDVVRELKEGYYSGKGASSAKDAGSRADENIAGLEEYFQFMMNGAGPSMTRSGQDQVRALYQRFSEATSRLRGTELANTLGQVELELRGIEKSEMNGGGMPAKDGYDSGSGSGSGSGSEYSSGYSSANSGKTSEYGKDVFGKDMPRYHPNSPDFTKFSYAEPWRLVAIIVGTFAFTWIFLTFGMVVDRIVGVQGLITAPHWAKPPMTRSSKFPWERGTPLGLQVYSTDRTLIPEELYWHENIKTRADGWKPHWMDTGHGSTRRLNDASVVSAMKTEGMKEAFTSLVSSLPKPQVAASLLDRLPTQGEAEALTNLESRFRSAGAAWQPQGFTWPGFFEPKLLACSSTQDGARHALAISPRGVAAVAKLGDIGEAKRFMLTGLSDYPALLAASWSQGPEEGLMLVSKKGDLLHCPGTHQGGQWACSALANAPARLPLAEGSRLAAAASAWLGDASAPRLHAAVILESSPDVVALWVLEGNTEAASWLPLGELPVPQQMTATASLAFVNNGELFLATADGATLQRRISDGTVVTSTPALNLHMSNTEKQPSIHWQAACGLNGPTGGIVHLSMRQQARSRRPEVMVLRTLTVDA